MPETAMTVNKSQSVSIVNQDWERPENLELIKKTVAPGLTDLEFAMFCHVARVRRLDPLQKQIYAIKRRTWNSDTNGYEDRMTLQVGIEGFRSVANRTGLYMPSNQPPLIEGVGTEDLRITVYVKKWHEFSKTWHEFSATAYYREFVQTHKNKATGKLEPVSMWSKMPINQLTKCCEALVLRKGWPEELGGVYTPEEIQRESVEVLPPDKTMKQNRTERELGTLKMSTEPNRGHGNEGTQRVPDKEICAECRRVNGHADDCTLNPKNRKQTKKNKREAWETQPGHDPKIHIGFDDAITLFEIQRDLHLTDDQVKDYLDKKYKIQHRYLIRQDQFQTVHDDLHQQFSKPAENPDAEPPEDLFFGDEIAK